MVNSPHFHEHGSISAVPLQPDNFSILSELLIFCLSHYLSLNYLALIIVSLLLYFLNINGKFLQFVIVKNQDVSCNQHQILFSAENREVKFNSVVFILSI